MSVYFTLAYTNTRGYAQEEFKDYGWAKQIRLLDL